MSTDSSVEFICLAAMMISLLALSIDAMLPALPMIAADFSLHTENDQQKVIIYLFIGLCFGQLFFGPLSDVVGRRKAILAGLLIFFIGNVLSLYAESYTGMLVGRVLQGFGVASPRTVMVAIVRDRYEGRMMARLMSFIMTIFILMPAAAPLLGQGLLMIGSWKLIFMVFIALALIVAVWFTLRQEETLPVAARHPFSFAGLAKDIGFILRQPAAIVGTFCTACNFSGFVSYLSTSQQIFVDVFNTGERFPFYFAALASAIGLASFVNAKLVMRFGMLNLCIFSSIGQFVLSGICFVLFETVFGDQPPLSVFMAYCLPQFFLLGLQFGNLNAFAMEPLGKVAGTGSSIVGFISTAIAAAVGGFLASQFDNRVSPVALYFLIISGVLVIALVGFYLKNKPPKAG